MTTEWVILLAWCTATPESNQNKLHYLLVSGKMYDAVTFSSGNLELKAKHFTSVLCPISWGRTVQRLSRRFDLKPHTQRSTWSWLMGRRHSRCRSRSQFGSLQRRQRKWWRLRWRDHLEKSKRYANTWTYRLRIYSSVVLYPTSHTGRAVTVFVHGGWTVLREYLWGEVTKVTQSKARLR